MTGAKLIGLERDAMRRDLLDAVQQIERVSAELQATVMDVRMLPMRHVFERFPRLVRDLARAQGKDVEFSVEVNRTSGRFSVSANELLEIKLKAAQLFAGLTGADVLANATARKH